MGPYKSFLGIGLQCAPDAIHACPESLDAFVGWVGHTYGISSLEYYRIAFQAVFSLEDSIG
jgi:hypothetical protein